MRTRPEINFFKDSENLSDVTTQNFICHLNVFVMTATKIILYTHTLIHTYRQIEEDERCSGK